MIGATGSGEPLVDVAPAVAPRCGRRYRAGMARGLRRPQKRPYRTPALWCLGVGTVLVLASLPQFFFGTPVSEGFAPAGFTLGPAAIIAGLVLYFSQRPQRGERFVEDIHTFRHIDL